MKQLFKYRWLLVSLAVVLVVVSLVNNYTGAWFTDEKTIGGDVETPIIEPVIYTRNGSTYEEVGVLYWNADEFNDTLTKPIYFGFTENHNVTNLVVRFYINIEWGTFVDDTFTVDSSLYSDSRILKPDGTFTSNFTKGYQGDYDFISEMFGEEYANELYESIPTAYYYNTLLSTNYIILKNSKYPVYNTLNFDSANYPNYADKTARITLSIEADFATNITIGETDGNELTVAGKWSPMENGERTQDGAPVSWINSIKNKDGYTVV